MITTRFEPYCQNCTELEATADITASEYMDGKKVVSICIYCENEEKCKAIKMHLKEEKE